MTFVAVSGLLLTSCSENKKIKHSIITEVYEVELSDDNYAAGKLKYMEQESYVNERIDTKIFYNSDMSMKGKEVYDYENGELYPSGSKFYGPNDKIMSTYQFEYAEDSLKASTFAYEGDTKNLLRIERFKYDDIGRMVTKTIHDALNNKDRTFLFGHDTNGNETSMSVLNKEDKVIITEGYEILTIDEKGRWLEKYGYVNGNPKPTTHYKRKRND